jgi:hypothetical protein
MTFDNQPRLSGTCKFPEQLHHFEIFPGRPTFALETIKFAVQNVVKA